MLTGATRFLLEGNNPFSSCRVVEVSIIRHM